MNCSTMNQMVALRLMISPPVHNQLLSILHITTAFPDGSGATSIQPVYQSAYTMQFFPCGSNRSVTVFWNGKSGFEGSTRGSLSRDRAIELHLWPCALICWMLVSKPGQNNCCLALAIILSTLWRLECSASSTRALTCFDIRILSPFMGTCSRQYNWSAISQNCWIFDGSLWRDFGNLSCIYVASIRHSSLVAMTPTILSQVMAHMQL